MKRQNSVSFSSLCFCTKFLMVLRLIQLQCILHASYMLCEPYVQCCDCDRQQQTAEFGKTPFFFSHTDCLLNVVIFKSNCYFSIG